MQKERVNIVESKDAGLADKKDLKNKLITVNKPHARRNAAIQYAIIAAAAVALGVTGGFVIKKKFGGEEITYSGFDPELFKANSEELLREYQKNPSKNFTPAELVSIGLEKYRISDNSYSIGIGKASTIVEQTIRSAQIKNGDRYFEEQISSSKMVSLANRATQSGDVVKLYKGKATGEEKGEYADDPTSYTSDDYKTDYGKTLQEMFVYIISNNTALADKCNVVRKGGKITVNLELDPNIASYYLKIQMKTMSNLSGLPTFEYIKHTYTFDESMNLLHSKVDEKYTASMAGINANIINNINYYYHAGTFIKIPELNENVDYSTEGEEIYE